MPRLTCCGVILVSMANAADESLSLRSAMNHMIILSSTCQSASDNGVCGCRVTTMTALQVPSVEQVWDAQVRGLGCEQVCDAWSGSGCDRELRQQGWGWPYAAGGSKHARAFFADGVAGHLQICDSGRVRIVWRNRILEQVFSLKHVRGVHTSTSTVLPRRLLLRHSPSMMSSM